MSAFIESLEEMAQKESRVRAVLKRSLAFEPGTYPRAFPYVENRLGGDDGWKRCAYYLTAGLWALSRAETGAKQSLSSAFKEFYFKNDKSSSVEKRFITLLDSDQDQLAHRMRQAVSLLKDFPIDFDDLLKDLLSWNHPEKWVQRRWAKDFYNGQD
jgi:CRISPR system Cascade subunit CasB